MRLSERERRELTDIEAGLVSADLPYVQRCDDISRLILLRAAEPPEPARGWRRIRHPRRHRDG